MSLKYRIASALDLYGLDLRKAWGTPAAMRLYRRDLQQLLEQAGKSKHAFPLGDPYPCLEDRKAASGSARGHYFHQDLLVASRIFEAQPQLHVDIGSRIDGFVAHVAVFREIEVIDIRPLVSKVANIRFKQADLMSPLDEALHGYSDSISCLHALEHFGLGRYGDPVNFDGWLLGLDNLHRMLRPGGTLYLSVPIGPQRIEFNAHRVFSVAFLMERFAGRFRLERFSYVDDRGDLHDNVELDDALAQASCDCRYGCGIFELSKPDA